MASSAKDPEPRPILLLDALEALSGMDKAARLMGLGYLVYATTLSFSGRQLLQF